jgi:peptidoglycan/xylan/chitin deacetylase (PgdA/CDA1 family)
MFDLSELMILRARGFVLAFHDIPPERLAYLVEGLQPAQPIPLSELVQRSKTRKPTSGLFAITVDDGVGETVRTLARLFCAKQWPASFYLPTQYVATGEAFAFQWWRLLQPLLPHSRLELRSGVLDLTRPGAVEELSRKMELWWHCRRPEAYLPLTMELADLVAQARGLGRAGLHPPDAISWPEVAELSRCDLIRFESHGVSHAAMSSLSEEELVREMKDSRDLIAEHSGRPCRHLAYPFGSPRSISRLAIAVAQRFYDSSATMSLGHVDFADPWLLPRIPLYPVNSRLFGQLKIRLKCGIDWREKPHPSPQEHEPLDSGAPDHGGPTARFSVRRRGNILRAKYAPA